jgi:hypothetical protein
MNLRHKTMLAAALLGSLLTLSLAAHAQKVRVTIQNLAPEHGNYLTPAWVGFHDGSFDLYDQGAPASAALERLAEDGNTQPISDAFAASGAGAAQATLLGPIIPPLAPGQMTSMDFMLDGSLASSRYFSYATMIIPSNDAFIANGDPQAFRIFDDMGKFLGADFFVTGAMALDAGTEVNDELPANTAFFGQAAPNAGMTEGGVVHLHPGFHPKGSGGILDDPMFANADFTADGYQIARITVTEVPEPGSVALLSSLSLAGVVLFRRRYRGK